MLLEQALNKAEYDDVHSLCAIDTDVSQSYKVTNPARLADRLATADFMSTSSATEVFCAAQQSKWNEKQHKKELKF